MLKIIEENREKLQEIFQSEGVVLAYLFGSQVRGTTHHFSDIDIGVLLHKGIAEDDYVDKTLALIGDIANALKVNHRNIDVVILNRTKPFLRYQIVFGGKLLFEKSTARRIFYENCVMKDYQDTKHILQFSLNAMKERIKRGSFGINPRSTYGSRSYIFHTRKAQRA